MVSTSRWNGRNPPRSIGLLICSYIVTQPTVTQTHFLHVHRLSRYDPNYAVYHVFLMQMVSGSWHRNSLCKRNPRVDIEMDAFHSPFAPTLFICVRVLCVRPTIHLGHHLHSCKSFPYLIETDLNLFMLLKRSAYLIDDKTTHRRRHDNTVTAITTANITISVAGSKFYEITHRHVVRCYADITLLIVPIFLRPLPTLIAISRSAKESEDTR